MSYYPPNNGLGQGYGQPPYAPQPGLGQGYQPDPLGGMGQRIAGHLGGFGGDQCQPQPVLLREGCDEHVEFSHHPHGHLESHHEHGHHGHDSHHNEHHGHHGHDSHHNEHHGHHGHESHHNEHHGHH